MKRVCHIISAFNRYDTRIFVKQCHALVQESYEVYLLVNDSHPNEVIDGIHIISCNKREPSRIQRILKARKTFQQHAIKIDADIYQIHDPELISLGVYLKEKGKRVVYDAHEDFPMQILEKDWIPLKLRSLISKFTELYLKQNLKKIDLVLSVTPHIVEKLIKYNKNTFCVTNYPTIEQTSVSLLKDYLTKDNILCYSGTVYKSSNQEAIIEAVEGLGNVKYFVVGEITEQFKQELSEGFARPNVEYLPHTTKDKIEEIYKNSTVGMAVFDYSPNLGYKTGSLGVNKFFEYMLFGLPIICTDFDLWEEIIEKYNCGICVKPRNVEQIRDAILCLINNKEKAYEMGQNGRRAVLEEYNWNSQKKIYVELFSRL